MLNLNIAAKRWQVIHGICRSPHRYHRKMRSWTAGVQSKRSSSSAIKIWLQSMSAERSWVGARTPTMAHNSVLQTSNLTVSPILRHLPPNSIQMFQVHYIPHRATTCHHDRTSTGGDHTQFLERSTYCEVATAKRQNIIIRTYASTHEILTSSVIVLTCSVLQV